MQAELVQHRLGGTDLALAAIDDDEVRHRPASSLFVALLTDARVPEPTTQHLLMAGEVVRAADGLDPEPAVLARAWLAVLEDDHAPDRFAATEVADVVALDPERRPRQAEGLRQLLQRRQGLALVSQPARLLAGQRLRGVARGQRQQLPLLASLRDT